MTKTLHHFGHMTSCFSLPLSFVVLQSIALRAEFLTLFTITQGHVCPSQRFSTNNSPNEYEHIVFRNLEFLNEEFRILQIVLNSKANR